MTDESHTIHTINKISIQDIEIENEQGKCLLKIESFVLYQREIEKKHLKNCA